MFLPCVDSRGALIGLWRKSMHHLNVFNPNLNTSLNINLKNKNNLRIKIIPNEHSLGFVGSSLLTGWMAVGKPTILWHLWWRRWLQRWLHWWLRPWLPAWMIALMIAKMVLRLIALMIRLMIGLMVTLCHRWATLFIEPTEQTSLPCPLQSILIVSYSLLIMNMIVKMTVIVMMIVIHGKLLCLAFSHISSIHPFSSSYSRLFIMIHLSSSSSLYLYSSLSSYLSSFSFSSSS